jgi:hypothetical protein
MVIQTGELAMADKAHMEAWAAVASEFPNLMAEHMADPSVLGRLPCLLANAAQGVPE